MSESKEAAERQMSDADVEAVVREFRRQMMSDFYGYVGRGVIGAITAPIFWLLLLLAVVGYGWATGAIAQHTIIGGSK